MGRELQLLSTNSARAALDVHEALTAILHSPWLGTRRLAVPVGEAGERRGVGERVWPLVRGAGFDVAFSRPGPAASVDVAPDAACHRHQLLIVDDRSSAERAARWVRQLARVSPRGHLVLDLRPHARRSSSRLPTSREDDDLVRQWIAAGHLDRAESVLNGLLVIAALYGRSPPGSVRRQLSWLRLWQGRSDQWLAERDSMGGRVEAWTRGDRKELENRAAHGWPRRATPAALILALMAAALARDPHRVARLSRALSRLSNLAIAYLDPLVVLAIAVDACLGVGLDDMARRWLDRMDAEGPRSGLYGLLGRWLRSRLEADAASEARLGEEIARMGAEGIRRWGRRTFEMPLLHAVPELLRIVNDAEDELSALTATCRWIHRQTGSPIAGILDAARGAVIAGEPGCAAALTGGERLALARAESAQTLRRADGVLVSAPVQYAGVRLGAVVCGGPIERQAPMAEAVASAAVVSAPAVRARLDAIALREEGHARMPEILGRSPAVAALREAIVRASGSTFAVCIEGESGSGKELVARAIHRLSARRDGRFAALNCAALTEELAESELFGHVRGAFTGAIGARTGLFEEAHLGTLFLDEVAELSARTQARLLRVLQEREVRRIGENVSRAVNVRIVSATNRPLSGLVSRGEFREDLLFRLAVIRIQVPPLRERIEDVGLLALRFWRDLAPDQGTRALLGADALSRLARHAWPGNVRELQNVVSALVVNAPRRGRVSARLVEHVLNGAGHAGEATPDSLGRARQDCERRTVVSALVRHGGRRARAARELGLSRQGLAKAIKRLQIESPETIEGVA